MQAKNLKNYYQIHKELGDIFTRNGRHYSSQDDLNIIHDEVFYYIENLNNDSEEQRKALRQALGVFRAPLSFLNIMKLAYMMKDQRLAQYLINMQLLPRPMYHRVLGDEDTELSNILLAMDLKPDNQNNLIWQNFQSAKNLTLRQLNASKLAFFWFLKGIRQDNSNINFLFYIPEIVNIIGEYVESNVFYSATNMASKCRIYLDKLEEKKHHFHLLPACEETIITTYGMDRNYRFVLHGGDTTSTSDEMDGNYQVPLVLHCGDTTSTSDEMDDEALINEFEILQFNLFKAPAFDPEKIMIELIKNLDTYINLKSNNKDWAFYSACCLKNTFNNNNNMDFKMFITDAYINKNTDQLFANHKGTRLLNAFQRACRGFEVSIAQGAKRYAEANSVDMLAAQFEILKLLKFQPPLAGFTEDVVKPGNQEKCCIQ